MLLLGACGIFGGILLWNRKILFDYLSGISSRFDSLKKSVSENNKNYSVPYVYISMFKIFTRYLYESMKYNSEIFNVKRKDKNSFILTYTLEGKLYKMRLLRRKGPPVVLLVCDQDGNDVSNLVIPFLGPERNWGYVEYTPDFFEKESLTFELASGENKKFQRHENIVI